MRREIRELMVLTFAVIALVVVLTHRAGFATFMSSLAGAYKSVVGAFITPTRA